MVLDYRDELRIAPGEDFVTRLQTTVERCDTLIVVIGRDWLLASDPGGVRRLDDPDDFIRLEVAEALRRSVPVFPA